MNNANLKETHPQKYYMRIPSNFLFYLGSGRFWYEAEKTRFPRLYGFWCVAINIYVFAGTLDKVLAYFRADLTEKEKAEVIQVVSTEIPVILKFYILYLKRQKVRDVLKNLLEEKREIFTSVELEAQAVKKARRLLFVYCMGAYAYITLFTVQKVALCFIEGVTVQTHVTYFPTDAHVGYIYIVCRILIICHFWVLVTTVLTWDCFAIMALIFVASKFKQTQMYFENMRDNPETEEPEKFKKSFINGIKFHENALWCARNMQYSLGHVYGIHIFTAIVLLAISLLNFAVSERALVNLAVNMLHSFLLVLLAGSYMINSGDITHEAEAVATSVFHCGWERVSRARGIRGLLVVAIHRAQQPVYMTAFGFLILSHENFISVMRSAYSFFAVFY